MASVCNDPNGTRRITWRGVDGKPAALFLGRKSEHEARAIALHVERLRLARMNGRAPHPDDIRWAESVADKLHRRLAHFGLVEPRAEAVTLKALVERYTRTAPVEPATLAAYKQTTGSLIDHFGAGAAVGSITRAGADEWRAAVVAAGYAPATVAKRVFVARAIFRRAVRWRLIADSPFDGLYAGTQKNPARRRFIDVATVAKVIDAAPDARWRLLLALSRFGGLRVPSEAMGLRWSDVDWSHSRITVRSPKTARHADGAERVIPVFAELRPHLLEAFALAVEGVDLVFADFGSHNTVKARVVKIIRRAGLVPWPKPWHNLRASRQTELAATFPLATVCAWIGNTKLVAEGHYLQVTDADFERAVGKTARKTARSALRSVAQGEPRSTGNVGKSAQDCAVLRTAAQVVGAGMGGEGFGQTHDRPVKSAIRKRGSAQNSAPDAPDPTDPDLAALIRAWPDLTAGARGRIMGEVRNPRRY